MLRISPVESAEKAVLILYFYWEGPTYRTPYPSAEGVKRKTVEAGTTISIGGPFSGECYHRFRTKRELERTLKGFRIVRMDFKGKEFRVLCQKKVNEG